MKNYLYILLLIVVAVRCGTEAEEKKAKVLTKSEMRSEIKEMDDSLKNLYGMLQTGKLKEIPLLNLQEAINRNLSFYRNYPNDPYAPECLDKAQQLFTQCKSYRMALWYSDTLLDKYPNYDKRAEVLLNAGSIADVMLNDTTLTRHYYSTLLKKHPKLNTETKETIKFRLEHLDLSFDEMIELQAKEVAGK